MKQIDLLLVLVGIIFFSISLASAITRTNDGMYPLGDKGQGVLLCGEAITINVESHIKISEVYDMFDEALFLMEEECAK